MCVKFGRNPAARISGGKVRDETQVPYLTLRYHKLRYFKPWNGISYSILGLALVSLCFKRDTNKF